MVLVFNRIKLKKKIFILFIISILFVCCSLLVFKPTTRDVEFANTKWSGTTVEQLQKGYSLYIGKCGGCHYLHKPTEMKEEDWMKILPDMSHDAKLTAEQYDLVVRYIITKSYTQLEQKK